MMLVEILILMNFISYLGHAKTSGYAVWFILRPYSIIVPSSFCSIKRQGVVEVLLHPPDTKKNDDYRILSLSSNLASPTMSTFGE